jgi:electron transfer flavoprotein alpha/beta subunit
MYLNELDVKKPLVVSISQRSEEQRLYNLVKNLTISNTSLKAVSSNASPG